LGRPRSGPCLHPALANRPIAKALTTAHEATLLAAVAAIEVHGFDTGDPLIGFIQRSRRMSCLRLVGRAQ
jgi:hypothetical protein